MARGYLGLGSNIGERRGHLQAAVWRLESVRGVSVLESSSVYETEPVGLVLDQPEFLNACVAIETTLSPLELLSACKAVERALGRTRSMRHGPRVIDVDVLLLDSVALRVPGLTVPHPELASRRFVLVPLLELGPQIALPDGTPLAGALSALAGGQAVRLAGPPLRIRREP